MDNLYNVTLLIDSFLQYRQKVAQHCGDAY